MNAYRTHLLFLVAVIVSECLTGAPAEATVYRWVNPSGGSWVNTSNWSPVGYPRFLADFAIFNLQASYDVDATDPQVAGPGGIQTTAGNVSLSTHDAFRAVLAVGTTGTPAVLNFSHGAITGAGVHNIGPHGTLVLEPGSQLKSTVVGSIGFAIEAGGTLRGDGGALENHVLRSFGTVSPGVAPGTAGVIRVGAALPAGYIQRETGVLDIEIGGVSPGTSHDQLRIENILSPVSLAGTLNVTLIQGFVPSSGDRFDVLTAPSITGTFATVNLPTLGGFEFSLVYEPTKVTVVATGSAPMQTYALDMNPGGCPNPLNSGKKGVVPAALLGAEERDVNAIDPSTVRLEGVAPARWGYEDVSAPFEGELCGCSQAGPDGVMDLTLKFSAPDLVEALGPAQPNKATLVTLTGNLMDGEPFEARDCVVLHAGGSGKGAMHIKVAAQTVPWVPLQRVSYELPETGEVRLSVFSPTGRKLAEIVRAVQPAGVHTAEWDASRIPGGIYFYHLEAAGLTESIRLLLFR
jgi:hypothetical protein